MTAPTDAGARRSSASAAVLMVRLTTVVTAMLTVAGCATVDYPLITSDPELEIIDASFSTEDRFSKRAYGSVGMGASRLEPDTSQNDSVDVNDRVEPAGQITVGADLSDTFSVELHSADLGSAGLSPEGRINYHMHGGSALAYAGRDRNSRRGLSGYGRVGVGAMKNSAVGDVRIERNHDAQLLVGAGAEYGWRNGVGVRGEVIVFDKDAQFAQLGVIYRVGGADSPVSDKPFEIITAAPVTPLTMPQTEPETDPLTNPTPDPVDPVVPAPQTIALSASDIDQDGIYDSLDDCPNSAIGVAIDETGCAVFNGAIEGINFARGSALLTQSASSILDDVVETLAAYPNTLVAIGAHTDSIGREIDNMTLSRQRAITVAKYLINSGVPKNMMSARAFGELVPVSDNASSEGRARNRRVELVASKGIAQ